MVKYTEIYRIRIDKSMKDNISKLKSYGIKPQQFIREAISQKIASDAPKIAARAKSNLNLIKIPF